MSPAIDRFITASDAKINALAGWKTNNIRTHYETLISQGRVESGWRTCCGSTHITQKNHREWVKLIKTLRKEGFDIKEEVVKHKNAYATNNGGFWNSIIYTLNNPR